MTSITQYCIAIKGASDNLQTPIVHNGATVCVC